MTLIDESHTLRNLDTQRYKEMQDFLATNAGSAS